MQAESAETIADEESMKLSKKNLAKVSQKKM